MGLIARTVFIICLPILLFTVSIGVAFNSTWLYRDGFEKYDISTVTGISLQELGTVARAIVNYWNSGEEYISVTVEKNDQSFILFNEREIIHLKDVKALVRLDYLAILVTGLYVVAYAILAFWYHRPTYRRDLAVAVFWGSILSLGIIGTVGVVALADFDGFWTQFHLFSFDNDLWLLDPSCDYLIMMFPEGFWFDSILIVAGLMIIMALLIGVSSWFFMKKVNFCDN